MKIDNSVKSVSGSPAAGRAKATTSKPATTVSGSGDQVQLSGRLQEVDATLANAPVVNADRVAEIKQAIADGRFQINPDRIANGLLDSVREMLNSRR